MNGRNARIKITATHHHHQVDPRPFMGPKHRLPTAVSILNCMTSEILVHVERVPQGPPKANDNKVTVND